MDFEPQGVQYEALLLLVDMLFWEVLRICVIGPGLSCMLPHLRE